MEEIMEIQSEEIDSAWDEDDSVVAVDDEPVEEVDQPAEPEAMPEEPAPVDQPETFTLKNREETKQVTRDELIAMAQQGWDYGRVREERDQLRKFRDEATPALELVKSYAQRNGMELGDYLDFCRKQELMAKGMSEEAAVEKVGMEKERAELDAREAAIKAQEEKNNSALKESQQKAAERQKDFEAFLAAYPDVNPQNISKEVWAAVQKGESLMVAYTKHENARLKAELAAERQNKINQQRTPGSLGGNAVKEMDEIDRIWAEDD
jgi:hypothetical protein